jgi:pimeloyl-ACP methyl ester carboxylesterase
VPTLVFLHEGLGCAGTWGDFPARLAARTGCGALIYSRSGYGDSAPLDRPRTARYLHNEGLTVLPQVLRTMGIRQSILIGHSDGASIALIYAGAGGAEHTLGLVLEAPHVFVEDTTIEGIKRTGAIYRTTDLAQRLARHHGDQTNTVFWSWYDTWLSPEFRHWNIEEYFPDITCPLLVIQGERDEYGTKRQVDAVVSQVSAPAEAMMLPECGHTPHREQAQVTLEAMTRFVQRIVL